mgnify:CR=1 FL=1
MREETEHTCQFCYYEYFDSRAYPCSMCVCGEERKDMFMPKGRENKRKDESLTDCGDFADRLAYERGVKHAWEVAQKVFNSTVTFYEAEDVAKQIDKDINVRSKDEPQTERSE